jgi:AcrR family transcriptional regulator
MTEREPTKDRILHGALEALARYGSRRFSMSLVAEQAAVSRATMYRYFPTKESLLDALTGHIGQDFRRFLQQKLSEKPDDDDVIALVVETMREYTVETPVLTQLLGAEPLFVRDFYHQAFDGLVRDIAKAIGPAFSTNEKTTRTRSDVLTAAEILVRVAISYRVIGVDRGPQPQGSFSTQLAGLLKRSAPG